MTDSLELTPAPRRTFKMQQPTKDTLRAQVRDLVEENIRLRARVVELEQRLAGGAIRLMLGRWAMRLKIHASKPEASEDGRE